VELIRRGCIVFDTDSALMSANVHLPVITTASRGIKGDVDVDVDGGITGVDALDCFPLKNICSILLWEMG